MPGAGTRSGEARRRSRAVPPTTSRVSRSLLDIFQGGKQARERQDLTLPGISGSWRFIKCTVTNCSGAERSGAAWRPGVADTRERAERDAAITSARLECKLHRRVERRARIIVATIIVNSNGALRGTERLDKFIRISATRELTSERSDPPWNVPPAADREIRTRKENAIAEITSSRERVSAYVCVCVHACRVTYDERSWRWQASASDGHSYTVVSHIVPHISPSFSHSARHYHIY